MVLKINVPTFSILGHLTFFHFLNVPLSFHIAKNLLAKFEWICLSTSHAVMPDISWWHDSSRRCKWSHYYILPIKIRNSFRNRIYYINFRAIQAITMASKSRIISSCLYLSLEISFKMIQFFTETTLIFFKVWPFWWNWCLSFGFVGVFDYAFDKSICFVILLLILLLADWVFETANRIKLTNSILIQRINTFESPLADGFLVIS